MNTTVSVSERVLIMAPVGNDAAAMGALLDVEGYETKVCAGAAECLRELIAGAGALVLTEEALELSNVSEVLSALQAQPPWSDLPLIILASGGESRQGMLLGLAATAARGATLLERPIGRATLIRAIEVALNSRRRQYQVRRLLEVQAQLAAIVTTSDDAIVSKTLTGIVTTWNVGAERMFGYTAREMVGESILKLIPPELHGEEDVILARLRNGDRIEHYETTRVTKSGRKIPVSLTISVMKDAEGKPIGASKIARDISERQRADRELRIAKEQAEAASRAKDNFLAALSHELRTPLTPVLMTAASLREDERLPAEVTEQLGMIERNVLLEARLIDDLLDLTRIAHGKLELRSEGCDIHSIIGLVVEILRDEARAKRIEITLDLAAPKSGMTGDPARLQQVFWNLLRNAVKFTPCGGHVRIRSRAGSGGSVCVEVSDDGVGLDAGAGKRIFEPFEQAGVGQRSRGGLGLGLSIARAVVDMHGGTIRVESEGLGKGAAFTVELPVSGRMETETAAVCGPVRNGHHKAGAEPRMRLLVVEDNVPTLEVLTRFLTRDGHYVVGVPSLAKARSAVEEERFDAVISDLGLPDGTGAELMRELRDRYGLRGIVLSGYGMEEDLRRSYEAGFTTHLVKPIDVNDLRRALRELSGMKGELVGMG